MQSCTTDGGATRWTPGSGEHGIFVDDKTTSGSPVIGNGDGQV